MNRLSSSAAFGKSSKQSWLRQTLSIIVEPPFCKIPPKRKKKQSMISFPIGSLQNKEVLKSFIPCWANLICRVWSFPTWAHICLCLVNFPALLSKGKKTHKDALSHPSCYMLQIGKSPEQHVSLCCLVRYWFWPQPFSVPQLCNSSVCKFSPAPPIPS